MRAKFYLVFVFVLWGPVSLRGQNVGQSASHPDDVGFLKKAIDILSGENMIVHRYTSGWDPGRPTEQGWAFSVIMKSVKPVEEFAKLTKTGSYYGLLGLYVLDRNRYKAELEHWRGADQVFLYFGDNIERLTAGDFLDEYLGEYGRELFDSLIFKELPPLTETVGVPVSSRQTPNIYHRDQAMGK